MSIIKSAFQIRRTYKEQIRRKNTIKRLGLNIKDRFYYPADTTNNTSGRKYSVIVPIYRVDKYLNDMLASLLRQTLDFKRHIEVVLVNDGSDDGSADICQEWVSRFPNNIKYLYKDNGGLSSARNYGIPHATGTWITFTDPDDILDKNYFLEVDKALDSCASQSNIYLIACPYISFYEESLRLKNEHPLRDRFRHGVRTIVIDDNCDEFQLSAATALFSRSKLVESGLKFEDLRPNGEDLHFIARLFLQAEQPEMMYVPAAKYWYRKRADASSLLSTGWQDTRRYSSLLIDNYADLFKKANQIKGYIPIWLQRTIIYDLMWHIRRFTNNHRNVRDIPEALRSSYIDNLSNLFHQIDPDLIITFNIGRIYDDHRFIMLSLGHPNLNIHSNIKTFAWDEEQSLVGIRHHYIGTPPKLQVRVGNQVVIPVYRKLRSHKFVGKAMAYSVDAWYPWHGSGMLSFEVDGEPVDQPVSKRAKASIKNKFRPKSPNLKHLPIVAKVYRNLSKSVIYKNKFRDAWLLMDRDTQADDNAEHLYRYIQKNHPEINAYFVLRKNSRDWRRLKQDKFKLIPFGSVSHKILLINARHLVSSHAAQYIRNYLPRRYYSDLMRWDYSFLQHGVIKDDLSQNLPALFFRNFIVSGEKEYNSIVQDGTGYSYSSREVQLTGFPRHDRLLRERGASKPKNILIMPTWRSSLATPMSGKTNDRKRFEGFTDSEFFIRWATLLSSERLHNIATENDLEIVFFPHTELKYYLDDFNTKGVRIASNDEGYSIQDEFLNAAVMITDYSSVAFELAYLERQSLYYQFDEEEFFSAGHDYQKGYFDYRRDGFGPVCTSQEQLLDSLESLVQDGCMASEPYLTRMREFFAWRDGRCCERVFNAINRTESIEISEGLPNPLKQAGAAEALTI